MIYFYKIRIVGDSGVWNSGVCGAAYNVQALSVCVRVRCAFLFRVSRGTGCIAFGRLRFILALWF